MAWVDPRNRFSDTFPRAPRAGLNPQPSICKSGDLTTRPCSLIFTTIHLMLMLMVTNIQNVLIKQQPSTVFPTKVINPCKEWIFKIQVTSPRSMHNQPSSVIIISSFKHCTSNMTLFFLKEYEEKLKKVEITKHEHMVLVDKLTQAAKDKEVEYRIANKKTDHLVCYVTVFELKAPCGEGIF